MAVTVDNTKGAYTIPALSGSGYVPIGGGTMTGALTIASGTLTASAPALSITQTWNEGSTTFTAINLAVTNTASGGGYFFNTFVGGVSQFNVDRGGGLYWGAAAGGAADANYVYTKNLALTNGSTRYAVDVILTRDAAANLALRNGTAQQSFSVYNTESSALTNYERLKLTGVAGSSVNITAESLGTGAANLDVVITPKGTGAVKFGTHSALAAETVTGYITIKDAGGTTRKLAVVS